MSSTKKWGLNVKGSGGVGALSSSSQKAKPRLEENAFDESSSSEEEDEPSNNPNIAGGRSLVNKELISQQAFISSKINDSVTTNSDIYDYDNAYDEINSTRVKKKEEVKEKEMSSRGQSKYIENLLNVSAQRTKEKELANERKIVRDIAKDDELYENKDKFITASYKRKLEERDILSKKDEESRFREEEDDRKRMGVGGMVGFHKMAGAVAGGEHSSSSSSSRVAGDDVAIVGKKSRWGAANTSSSSDSSSSISTTTATTNNNPPSSNAKTQEQQPTIPRRSTQEKTPKQLAIIEWKEKELVRDEKVKKARERYLLRSGRN